jgi:hypothetical protein
MRSEKHCHHEDFVRDEGNPPMVSASGPFVALDDLEYAAIWAIVRACNNSNRLGLARTARMLEFDNWFYENVARCNNEQAIQA